ncbi:MAG: InlB B-repeat-containing protein, partial [Oscillospiraceae bacterium]|nr:InlB B-repeat-containing protein [Oscillospiraceae bacterium]
MKAKRLIAALLCFLLIGSMLPVSAFAAGGVIGRYTLTLDENWEGGTGQVIPNITSYVLPSVTRPGETFYGWATVPDGTVRYLAGDTVTLSHNLTLYAVWHNVTDNGYYVIFDANGGMGTMESIWFGTPATIPDCGFTRDGYTFIGWATSPTGAVAYLPGASYKSPADLFLFAVWEQNDYHTVAFDATGGSVTPASGTTNADGKLASLPMPTKSGYIFCGWYDAPTGGNCVTTATVFTADSTIYARWAGGGVPQEGYSLTLDENWEGGAVQMIPNVILHVLPSVMRPGYVLDGWSTDPAGSVEYRENDIITLTADTTLYALWSKSNAPTLILNENWEFGRVRTIPNVSSYELPSVTRSGETFFGWANAPDGMVRYRAGDTVTLTHNLTLYAIWWAQNYSIYHVIFDANGGTGTMENLWGGVAGNDDASIPVTIPDCGFTREGYTFKGWATSPDGAVAYLPGASYKSPDDLFLFAVWEQNDYHTVTVNNDGNGTATADKTSAAEDETVTLTAAPNAGYHFKEWQSSDVAITDNSFTMPKKDVTVKAIFEADAPTTYTGTGWNLDADGVLHITGAMSESRFDLSADQKLQVKSVVAESGASISSGEALFSGFKNMTSADLSLLNTTGVTSMGGMFYNCSDLTSLDLSGFDTSSVNDMSSMFEGCSSLTSLDVSGFSTNSVNDMSSMFEGCSSLTSLDVSGFNTSSVTEMHHMFSGCSSLTSLDVSGFDTSSVNDMSSMFADCSSLTSLDVSGFIT